ncbi:MAG: tRNA uridine-5-carboxymethylaminomethyl(34) synthesis GTPase MnmE [Acidobacteriota bacterium]
MQGFSTEDTIVAIATPPGRGGIGVVRVAGPRAVEIARSLTGREEPLCPRHATFARIVGPASNGGGDAPASPRADRAIDQVVITWFVAPHSYTGDDVVEISGHGSPLLLKQVVELAIAGGARLAEPGEFTLRAYLNGRIDLAQAEAVADLVNAVTPLQARSAMDQLEGTLTGVIRRIDAALFDLAARLEASLDFPDEGFHFITREETVAALAAVRADLDRLAEEGRAGRLVREGRVIVIGGPPNAGKSSLFNALLGADRAIVTDVPGTTRDVLSERVDIGGVPVTLVDTAGLREASDAIEAEGVRRARAAHHVAAMAILVLDRSAPLPENLSELFSHGGAEPIVVVNKIDLPAAWDVEILCKGRGQRAEGVVRVSALTGSGLEDLRRRLTSALTDREDLRDPPAISNVRHLALVDDAREALARGEETLAAGATEELVLAELAAARRALEEITGRRTADDVLEHIFSSFCVGK